MRCNFPVGYELEGREIFLRCERMRARRYWFETQALVRRLGRKPLGGRAEIRVPGQFAGNSEPDLFDQIRKLPEADQTLACKAAFLGSPLAKSMGVVDLRRELDLAWMKEAERALAANRVTVAMLPFTQLVAPGGYLAMLEERG